MAGVGIARTLSYQAAEAIAPGAARALMEAFEPGPVPVQLLFDARAPTPLKLRRFVDFAAPRLSARLAGLRAVKTSPWTPTLRNTG